MTRVDLLIRRPQQSATQSLPETTITSGLPPWHPGAARSGVHDRSGTMPWTRPRPTACCAGRVDSRLESPRSATRLPEAVAHRGQGRCTAWRPEAASWWCGRVGIRGP